MGYVLEISCNNCNYKNRLELGQGMKDCHLEKVLSRFSCETGKKIHMALYETDEEIQRAALWNYDKKLGYCPNCRAYHAVPVMQLMSGEECQIFADKCDCGEEYEIFSDDIENHISQLCCPICSGEMSGGVKGYWD